MWRFQVTRVLLITVIFSILHCGPYLKIRLHCRDSRRWEIAFGLRLPHISCPSWFQATFLFSPSLWCWDRRVPSSELRSSSLSFRLNHKMEPRSAEEREGESALSLVQVAFLGVVQGVFQGVDKMCVDPEMSVLAPNGGNKNKVKRLAWKNVDGHSERVCRCFVTSFSFFTSTFSQSSFHLLSSSRRPRTNLRFGSKKELLVVLPHRQETRLSTQYSWQGKEPHTGRLPRARGWARARKWRRLKNMCTRKDGEGVCIGERESLLWRVYRVWAQLKVHLK